MPLGRSTIQNEVQPAMKVRRHVSLHRRQRNQGGHMAGQIVHIEIPADDTEKGQAFWGGLFGWQFQVAPGTTDYFMTRISEQGGAAITGMEPGKKGARAYFDVDDINAGAAKVKELGGDADQPMPVPNMGWFATCRDPHGNEFGLWQTDSSAA
jgi:predicted enzyme related to lactoylglutathione lyase